MKRRDQRRREGGRSLYGIWTSVTLHRQSHRRVKGKGNQFTTCYCHLELGRDYHECMFWVTWANVAQASGWGRGASEGGMQKFDANEDGDEGEVTRV